METILCSVINRVNKYLPYSYPLRSISKSMSQSLLPYDEHYKKKIHDKYPQFTTQEGIVARIISSDDCKYMRYILRSSYTRINWDRLSYLCKSKNMTLLISPLLSMRTRNILYGEMDISICNRMEAYNTLLNQDRFIKAIREGRVDIFKKINEILRNVNNSPRCKGLPTNIPWNFKMTQLYDLLSMKEPQEDIFINLPLALELRFKSEYLLPIILRISSKCKMESNYEILYEKINEILFKEREWEYYLTNKLDPKFIDVLYGNKDPVVAAIGKIQGWPELYDIELDFMQKLQVDRYVLRAKHLQ